jgi:hypothetical protein
MTRKSGIALALLCAGMLSTATAFAATPSTMTFGVSGAAALPMGDFGDVASTGFGGGVYGDYWLSSNFAIGVDGMWNSHGGNDDNGFGDVDFTNLQVSAHGKYQIPMEGSPMSPWLTFGVGMYNMGVDTGVSDDSESNFGINVGGGLDWWSSPAFGIGPFLNFHNIFTEDESTTYMNVGLNFTFTTSGS